VVVAGLYRSQKGLNQGRRTERYAEEAEGRRPVVGTVYVDKYELPKPFPKRIRVTIEIVE